MQIQAYELRPRQGETVQLSVLPRWYQLGTQGNWKAQAQISLIVLSEGQYSEVPGEDM